MQQIKNIIFDFGGVIVSLARNKCIATFEELGVAGVRELISNNYLHKDLFFRFENGQLTIPEFYDGIRAIASHPLTDEEIKKAWILMLDSIDESKLECIRNLNKKYNVSLLSNTNEIHWTWALSHGFEKDGFSVEDYFEHVFLSYELEMQKPDLSIFNHVLKTTGYLPEETLFIDDALVNCLAAESLGIQTYTPLPREDWMRIFDNNMITLPVEEEK